MDLKSLSDDEVLRGAVVAAEMERMATSNLLLFIREVDERKLYCDGKNTSLFHYCIKVLKLSEGSAQRRISAMKLAREIPEVCSRVETGELNLSIVSRAQSFFRKEAKFGLGEKKEILETLSHKSCRESERELLKLSSQPEIHTPDRVKPVSQTHVQVQFVASDEQMALFEKARGLLANTNPEMTWADLFQKVTEIALKKIDPLQHTASPTRSPQNPNRRVPNTSLKREILKKAGGKCENCGSTYRLNYDHVDPWMLGGETTAQNLRLLCRNCNQRQSIKAFGRRSTKPIQTR
jgi:5-methylcytosine-specific restriction endonuclease McrA